LLLFHYSNHRLQSFAEFIDAERDKYPEKGNNLATSAFEAIFKRYRFIWRFKELADPLIEAHILDAERKIADARSGPLDKIELQAMADSIARSNEIRMFFECFYMHGSIMCDELAQLILFFFGDERGIKMGKHRELSKNFERYAAGKKLAYPESLIENAAFLETELCDFRDKQIVHDFNPRKTKGLGWSLSTKDMNLSAAGFLYPKPSDTGSTSKGWNELICRLDEYVWQMLHVVEVNRLQSKLLRA
jgi:hypothetical protein